MPKTLKKTVYIGLGGTGVESLLKIKKCFIDSYGEVPPMIGFLAIDTDGGAATRNATDAKGNAVTLQRSELLLCSVKGALNVYQTNPTICNWVPQGNVQALASIQGGGAGQVRSNGRFIAYHNKEKIVNAVSEVFSRVSHLLPQDSTYAVSHDQNGMEYPTEINVIASVAGGTGSGMLIDVLLIINDTLQKTAATYHVYPWIVLPEVFRAVNAGPAMANVEYNTYGALRELDYIKHHSPSDPAIDLGYAMINEPLFDYAYLINNKNSAGVTFNTIDDITTIVANSAFMPANDMGNALQTPFDNIRSGQAAGTYDILNKQGWASSAAAAELVYDAKAVCRAQCYNAISRLCADIAASGADRSARFARQYQGRRQP